MSPNCFKQTKHTRAFDAEQVEKFAVFDPDGRIAIRPERVARAIVLIGVVNNFQGEIFLPQAFGETVEQ